MARQTFPCTSSKMYRKRVIFVLCCSSISLWLLCSYLLAAFLVESDRLSLAKQTEAYPNGHRLGQLSVINLKGAGAAERRPLHILYNVGCGGKSYPPEYQLLQALALEQTWSEVGQRGNLTRIVSGCTSSDIMRRTSLSSLHDLERFEVGNSG